MPAITAAQVNELRAKTGQAMMECKRMLVETDGDVEKAVDAFRKKGVKTSIAERAATEGRVAVATSADGKTAAAVELNCNTDFTAKSDGVAELVEKAAKKLVEGGANALADDAEFKSALTNLSQTTGENVVLGRTAVVQGESAGSYLYTTAGKGKIAVLVAFDKAAPEGVVNSLGMHVAAAKPVAMTRDKVSAELVAREKDIAVEQAKASGKPQAIAEKIAEGKMNAFYAEKVLLDQEFVNPDAFKGKISDMLKAKGVALVNYARLEVGQA